MLLNGDINVVKSDISFYFKLREMEDNFITVIVGDREYIIDHIKSVKTHANMDDSCMHKALICDEMSGKNIIR